MDARQCIVVATLLVVVYFENIIVVASHFIDADQTCDDVVRSKTNFTFPHYVVPAKLKFMVVVVSNCNHVVGPVGQNTRCKNWCLEENRNLVKIALCNRGKLSQKWFQIGSLLSSTKSGKCISSKTGITPFLEFCNATSVFQRWSCVQNSSPDRFFLQTSGSFLTVENSELRFKLSPSTYWKVATDSGYIMASPDVVCHKRQEKCRIPLPGLHSFRVSSPVDTSILYRENNVPPSCYVLGDVLVVHCAKGHIKIGSSNTTQKVMTCLGDGIWSNPKPLHCIKRSCVVPFTTQYTEIVGRSKDRYSYGDLVQYKCIHPYHGKAVLRACGPRGTWVGPKPDCSHVCVFNLTSTTGQILSTNYPKAYPNSLHCEWHITVSTGLRIALWFRDFYLERGSFPWFECKYDFLYVHDLSSENKSNSAILCGSRFPEHWYSSGNQVVATFHSDSLVNGKGFKIDYSTWNESETDLPYMLNRTGSFPDEEDKTYTHTQREYFSHILEALYMIVVLAIVTFLLGIIALHMYGELKCLCRKEIGETDEEDFLDDNERKRKLAQRRMTTVFDPVTIAPSVLINPGILGSEMSDSDSGSITSVVTLSDVHETDWSSSRAPIAITITPSDDIEPSQEEVVIHKPAIKGILKKSKEIVQQQPAP